MIVKGPLTRSEIRARNRADLIRSARELIVERGYHATQLDEIAARVGLTKGAVYSIFGSKQELLVAVVRDNDDVLSPLALALRDHPGTAEDVLEQLADFMLALAHDPDAQAVLTFQLEFVSLTMRDQGLLEVGRELEEHGLAAISTALAGRPTRTGSTLSSVDATSVSRHALAVLQGLTLSAVSIGWAPARSTVNSMLAAVVASQLTSAATSRGRRTAAKRA